MSTVGAPAVSSIFARTSPAEGAASWAAAVVVHPAAVWDVFIPAAARSYTFFWSPLHPPVLSVRALKYAANASQVHVFDLAGSVCIAQATDDPPYVCVALLMASMSHFAPPHPNNVIDIKAVNAVIATLPANVIAPDTHTDCGTHKKDLRSRNKT